MTTCEHVRQVPDLGEGGDGLMDIRLGDVLPCAEPGCPAGLEGEQMAHIGPAPGYRAGMYTREATGDGWCWRKAVPQ